MEHSFPQGTLCLASLLLLLAGVSPSLSSEPARSTEHRPRVDDRAPVPDLKFDLRPPQFDVEAQSQLTEREADEIVKRLETIELPARDVASDDDAPMQYVNDVHEAVLRYLFDHNHSALQRKAETFCVKVDNVEPDVRFLRRFRGERPTVRSSATFRAGTDLLFEVEGLDWNTPNHAVVYGGYYESDSASSGSRFHVTRYARRWSVTVEERIWETSPRSPRQE